MGIDSNTMKHYLLKKYKKGVSLVEMLIYVTLLSVIFLLIVSTVLSFTSSYRQLSANRALEHTTLNVLERMTRDIRNATQIDASTTVFGSSSGTLGLIQTYNGVSTTTKFALSNGVVNVYVNGTYIGPLTVTNSSVTALTFTDVLTGTTDAVKIDMTVTGTSGAITRTKTFHTTVVLRGS